MDRRTHSRFQDTEDLRRRELGVPLPPCGGGDRGEAAVGIGGDDAGLGSERSFYAAGPLFAVPSPTRGEGDASRRRFGAVPRRSLLAGFAAAGVWSVFGPSLAVAKGAVDRPLVFIILRGGLDGLAAVAPVEDPRYAALRGELALKPPGEAGGALALGEGMGLHPALAGLHGLYGAGELSVLHAAATPYRDRSHFDGQDVLESGGEAVYGHPDGWLNRALQTLGPPPEAVAVGAALPLVLRGEAAASSWSPSVLRSADEDTLARLAALYDGDPVLAPALAQAVETNALAGDGGMGGGRRGGGPINYEASLRPAGRLIAEGAAALAVVSLDGWDTHANQGAEGGALALRLAALDRGLTALKAALGPKWSSSAIMVATEFGRTAAVNGTRGTDHGTGGAAFLLGGAVAGGRILGDWPGLGRLHEDRDVRPANDLRALFKGVLRDHWGVDRADLDGRVFPGSAGVPPLDGLIA
jgi:uncharacterized protein (DUF1501 family)